MVFIFAFLGSRKVRMLKNRWRMSCFLFKGVRIVRADRFCSLSQCLDENEVDRLQNVITNRSPMVRGSQLFSSCVIRHDMLLQGDPT